MIGEDTWCSSPFLTQVFRNSELPVTGYHGQDCEAMNVMFPSVNNCILKKNLCDAVTVFVFIKKHVMHI